MAVQTRPREEEEERVTPLELFFDLIFVFAITQLTATVLPGGWEVTGRSALLLLLLPPLGLLDLLQNLLLVGEQVRDAGVLLQLGLPLRVLLGLLPGFALLSGRSLFDLVS